MEGEGVYKPVLGKNSHPPSDGREDLCGKVQSELESPKEDGKAVMRTR